MYYVHYVHIIQAPVVQDPPDLTVLLPYQHRSGSPFRYRGLDDIHIQLLLKVSLLLPGEKILGPPHLVLDRGESPGRGVPGVNLMYSRREIPKIKLTARKHILKFSSAQLSQLGSLLFSEVLRVPP